MWSKHPDMVAAWLLAALLLVAVGTAPLSKMGTSRTHVIDVATQRYDTNLPTGASAAGALGRATVHGRILDDHDAADAYMP